MYLLHHEEIESLAKNIPGILHIFIFRHAEVAELADATDLKSVG